MAKRIRFDASLTAGENARRMLPLRIAAYFAAGRTVAAEAADARDLHRFRLEGKRLRYTMELFAPCYGPGWNRYLTLLRGAQTWLGDLNDCDAAMRLLAEIEVGPGHRRKAARFLKTRSAELYAGFQRFWREDVDAPGVERRWSAYATHTKRL